MNVSLTDVFDSCLPSQRSADGSSAEDGEGECVSTFLMLTFLAYFERVDYPFFYILIKKELTLSMPSLLSKHGILSEMNMSIFFFSINA